MATRVFSDSEIEALRGFPEASADELVRYFRLAAVDLEFARRRHGDANRLGVAVQIAVLGWLGYVPVDLSAVPCSGVERLAGQLGVSPSVFDDYAPREQTRSNHFREVAGFLGWRPAGEVEWKELDRFLLSRAMEHDSPSALFRLACDFLKTRMVIRPGPVMLVEHVAAAREGAKAETYQRIEHLLTDTRRAEIDRLLTVDTEIGNTRLYWLGHGATRASPAAVKDEVDKLIFLRGLDADVLDLSPVPAERRRFLAGIGRRSTAQALARSDGRRRYPILLALLTQTYSDVLDEVVGLFDQTLSGRESHAKNKLDERLADRARAAEERIGLLDEILAVVADESVPDPEVGERLRSRIGMDRLQTARSARLEQLPRDWGHLSLIEASFGYIREFAPAVLAAVRFAGGTDTSDLIEATDVLMDLYATGGRKVPAGTPDGFVPTRWRSYLDKAATDDDTTAYRHYWELCVLLGLRDGLRSGDVWIPGSRRYGDPSAYLMPTEQWATERDDYCGLVSKASGAGEAISALKTELGEAVDALDATLAESDGPVRLDDAGRLVVGKLAAATTGDEVDELRDRLTERLPRAQLASVLVEIDQRCGFTDLFTHAAGKTARSPELTRNLYACLTAFACNIGLTAMAEASGISYDILAWTADWYFREDTLRAAIAHVVNYHHGLAYTQAWGSGALSSSDGQRFPTRGKSISARALSRYFVDEGISTYTHVSDQHSAYGTQVIVATGSEATYVLDEILGNATDLPISEHVTDTGGVTLVNFALFDLVGFEFSPRIRDLGKVTLYRIGTRPYVRARWPQAGKLLAMKANTDLIAEHWDDILRLAAALKYGRATASLIVGKLCASPRQNAFAAALKEYGAIRRTIHAARYLSDEDRQRRVRRQLNKGEAHHSLRRCVYFAGEGRVSAREPARQHEQALCLSLVSNLVVAWNTEYLARAVDAARADGEQVDDGLLGYISPAITHTVAFHGTYSFDLDRERARLDPGGYRPLRHQPTCAPGVNLTR